MKSFRRFMYIKIVFMTPFILGAGYLLKIENEFLIPFLMGYILATIWAIIDSLILKEKDASSEKPE